ncbi:MULTISPECIES: gliding motility-associated C-terminal domain-containing protein [unclassified Mesoflavibacter]|uniref:gliding motility-associated C-terminal domain-containing protein n=2 Tax=Mesoflavibacter TaxID=444051 RepID=UPI0013F49A4B|nr:MULTISPECIES: gliding motility-associated C-terminal domain-containing protein [unclassified Mesoflavibacter]
MKLTINYKKAIIFLALILSATFSFAQVKKSFSLRYQSSINGDVIVVGNNTVSRTATGNYNGEDGNHDFADNVYVDIDNDNTTFNSSSANIVNPKPDDPCLAVDKVLLYWAAADKGNINNNVEADNQPNWNYNQVKLMLPGQTTYSTITADQVIFRGRNENPHFINDAYICVKDITSSVLNNNNSFGKYQVANVEGKQGYLVSHDGNNTGTSGGWQIVLVYKSDNLKRKNISLFDGYANVTSTNNNFDINFNGFLTVPNGAVRSDIIIGALEGDRDLAGDRLQMRNTSNVFVDLDAPLRDANNFFNSRITLGASNGSNNFTDRNPASLNTLGFDSAIFPLQNQGNSLLDNNQTSTTLRLTSNQETYGLYLLGLAVEVYEPKLDPIFFTATPNSVIPGTTPETITYTATTSNTGNDNATNITFTTNVPVGSELVQPIVGLPTGMTYTYNNTTRQLTFYAANGLLDVGDTLNFNFQTTVNDQCYYLENGCSTVLNSQLEATYNGELNGTLFNIVSSNSLDTCNQGNNLLTTVIVNPPLPATWVTAPFALDRVVDCDDTTALINAQALSPIASCSNLTPVKTSGNFVPTDANCNYTGTYTNTWTFTDACGNTIADYAQVITVVDNTPPTFTVPSDIEIFVDNACNYDPSILNTGDVTDENDNCSSNNLEATYSDTITNGSCEGTYTITRTWSLVDNCGNPAPDQTQIITVSDNISPDLSACTSVVDTNVDCTANDNQSIADQWNSDNIAALQACASDNCSSAISVTSDYDFNNLNTVCGPCGNITVTYTVTDDCNNASSITVTLTFGDASGPDLSTCNVNDATLECNGNDNQLIADQWNNDNIAMLQACANDIAVTISSNYDFNNFDTTAVCGLGGILPVTYTATDACGNTTSLNATLTLSDTTGPDVSACTSVVDATLECDGTNNNTLASDWNAANIAALETCASDTCDADNTFTVTSDFDFNNFVSSCGLGGTITVNYTVSDDCGNSSSTSATLTLSDTTGPDLSACTSVVDATLECDGTNNNTLASDWNAANIAALETCASDACDADNTFTVTSDFDFNNFVSSCGLGGTITVNYTVSDDCGNSSSTSATLTLSDTTGPDVSACTSVVDATLECDGTNNSTLASDWNATNIAALETCASDACDADNTFTVTSDFDFNNFVSACGLGGTITVNYTVSDDCGNSSSTSATLTLSDTTGPDVSACTSVVDATLECDGTNNSTLASDWNAANIAALETCASDACDADNTFTVTSDFDFNNFVSACGLGGTITVNYTVSDDCGNSSSTSATLTLSDTTGPDVSACTSVVDTNVDCTANDNQTIADQWNSDNIAALQACASDNCSSAISVTSDYDFNNLNTVCGPCGNIAVTYTVTDDCNNASSITVTLTFGDASGPDLSTCNVNDATLECNGNDNQLIADQWNNDNIAMLQACANDIAVTISSNYDFNNFDTAAVCGLGGILPVTYTATDACGNTTSLTATLTLSDTTGPDVSACTSVVDSTLECDGTNNNTLASDWNAANIAALETCASDACDADNTFTVTSDFDFNNFVSSCGLGGTITVNYTVSDDCGNSSSTSATLTLSDTTGPDLSACTSVVDATLECDGTNNNTLASDWNAANIAALETCASDACDADNTFTVTSDFDFNNFVSSCGLGGTITVNYTVSDDCGNSSSTSATLTLSDTTGPDLSACTSVVDATLECDGTNNNTLASDWNAANIAALETCASDACDADNTFTVTSDFDFNNFVSSCGLGGTITVNYTVSDDCGNSSSTSATLTLSDTTGPDVSACTSVVDATLECDGTNNSTLASDWNATNIAALETCASDACDADNTFTVTSDFDFNNFVSACGLGGTITVNYTVSDDCGNSSSTSATLTLSDTTGPDVSACTSVVDATLECDGTNNSTLASDWNAANIAALETCASDACDADNTFTVTSDFDFNNFVSSCGLDGTITVNYTVSDDCGNSSSTSATLTLSDTTGPELSACTSVVDTTLECDGTNNSTLASDWNAANIAALETCASDNCSSTISVTSDFDFNNFVSACGLGGTITVNYTVSDDCGNSSSTSATLTLSDTTGPDVSACTSVVDATLECDGTNNSTLASDWNAANIAALETCASDNCSSAISVTSDFDFNNFVSSCGLGGTITVNYMVSDDCGNSSSTSATLTLSDTTGPDLSACTSVVDANVDCTANDNQTIADQWNSDNIAALQACASDNCSSAISVTSDYDFNNLNTVCGPCGNITVTYTVTDDCNNASSITVTLTFGDASGPDLSTCNVNDATLECNGNDNQLIADQWNNDNIAMLQACANDIAVVISSNYDFNNFDTTAVCGLGGILPVTYTATDACGNTTSLTATLTLSDTTGPDVSACTSVVDATLECDGTNNNTLASDWNAANIAALETCASDACDADNTFTVTSDFDFNNFVSSCGLGGTITVNYTVSDDCGNSSSTSATLTLSDTTGPDLSACTSVVDATLECDGTNNNTLASDWNAANIAALETCASDACDADNTFTVTSDFDFNNFVSSCGLGGTITVNYTVSDDCGNSSSTSATLTLSDTTGPDVSACTSVVDATLECDGTNNSTLASDWNATNIAALETCASDACDADNTFTVTSDFDFNNFVSACGLGGTITVNYTVSDDCGNSSSTSATLTLSDTTGPDVSACTSVVDATLECDGTNNSTLASDWNAANIAALETCASDACDADNTFTVTSDFDFNNFVSACGLGGTITVNYTVSDDCGNSSSTSATLTLSDTTGPDVSACTSVVDTNVDCTANDNQTIADQWNSDNIAALQACASDNCSSAISVTSDYDFNNLNTVCGPCGNIAVTYTVTDDCNNASSITVTLTFGDASGPDLSTCNVNDATLECNGNDNQLIADQWNNDNIAMLQACANDIAVTISSNYDFNNFDTAAVCGLGGILPVTYTATDACGNTTSLTATLTLSDTTGPDVSACTSVVDSTLECDGTNNNTLASDWNAANIAALETCASDACDADNTFTVTSDFDFNNFVSSCGLGGTITVNYTVSDDCGNSSSTSATLTLSDTTGPDLSACTSVVDATLECDGTNNNTLASDWNAANIAALETCASDACDADNTFTVTSDFDFNNFVSSCGLGGTITVNYTVSDDCGNSSSTSATLTLSDTTGPDLSACTSVVDATLECDGTNNNTLASDWNAANIAALETCASDACDADNTFTVTSDFDFNNFVSSCGLGGTITVNYTVSDDCGNSSSTSATLTLSDTTGPDVSACTSVVDATLECDGTNNSTLASDWNATNIAALETCASDACDADNTFTVTSDFDFNNFVSACGLGGTITVNYTVSDDCGNSSSTSATLTLSDTTGPDVSACTSVVDATLECDGTNNSTLASDWNAANIAALETCASDACDADNTFTVTSDFDFNNFVSSCGLDGTITVNYTVSDDCGNSSSTSATLTLSDTTGPELSACTSVVDTTLECDGTNNSTLASDWNAANIAALETCASDNCSSTISVTSDFDFNNFVSACGLGGTITVNYTVSDDCGNSSSTSATLTLSDTTGPDVSACTSVVDATLECDGTNNSTLASDWNAANIAALETCASDNCSSAISVTSDFDFNNFVSSCGLGGTITVNYMVSDDCGNSSSTSATLTLSDTTGPDVSACTSVVDTTLECDGTNNSTLASDWNATNIAALETCTSDACDADNTFTVTSDFDFNNFVSSCGLGGTITVNYTVSDDCGNSSSTSATLTLSDTTGPDVSACTSVVDATLECDGTNNSTLASDWNATNIAALETCSSDACDADNTFTVTSDFDFNNFVSACGLGGTITVNYTISDDCGNSSSTSATLTLSDTTGPDVSACTSVVDATLECDGANNSTLASDWNAANIAALETCASDACDADNTFTVTSDFDFNNFVSACGLGGTITVNYTVSDDCGNSSSTSATLTLSDTTGPDVSACTSVVDATLECDGANNNTLASDWNAANIAALETCASDACDADNTFTVTSDFDLNNFVSSCGLGGTITVNYTISDDCGNSSSTSATLTLSDTTGPDLSACTSVVDTNVDCTANDNQTIADQWNSDNIAALQACASDNCSSAISVTSDYDFNNLNTVCGPCGNIAVTYTVTDDCNNASSITVTLTFGDASGPDLSTCNVNDATLECNGNDNQLIADQWNNDNIAMLQACANDIAVTISSNYDFNNFDSTAVCGLGGILPVTYTATDACGNTTSLTATLTLSDTTGPDLSACTSVVDATLECDGANNSTLASDWNATNIAALETCASDACDADNTFTVTSDFDFNNFVSSCGLGGTITVNYTVSDDCGNSSSTSATLTLSDTTGPDVSACTSVVDATLECDGTNNSTLASDWNAANIAALETCASDNCSSAISVTSDFDFNNFVSSCGLGGTITVNYTVSDDCGNSSSTSATLTLSDTTGPDVSACTSVVDATLECDGTNNSTLASDWNAANIAALETCASDNCSSAISVTSDFDFNNFVSTCGLGGTITVNYTVSDDCGNSSSTSATLTLSDTTGPDVSACTSVVDATLECDGANNNTLASDWNAANIAALETCASDACDADNIFTVTSDFDFNNFVSTCGLGGTITVNYTVSDDCGNSSSTSATLTLSDTTGPDVSACTSVVDATLECDGANNNTLASDWNAANIAALETCASDACDADNIFTVTSDFDFNNFVSTCGLGGTITVNYIVSDDCGNSSSTSATLTLSDTTGPDVSACTSVVDATLECDGTNNSTLASDWNAANIAALETCASDNCSSAISVTSDFDFNNFVSTCGLGGTITVNYTVSDDCGNSSSTSATLTLSDTTGPDVSACTSVVDATLECDGANNNTLASDWNAANIAALETCASDACDADNIFTVTSDFDFNNFVSTCGLGGTITVNYIVSDDCGNSSSTSATLTLSDTTGPELSSQLNLPNSVTCSEIPEIPTLDFIDNCSAQDISISFEEISTFTGNEDNYTITWNWVAIDDCGNETQISHTINVTTENYIEEIYETRCFEDGEIDLYQFLPAGIDDTLEWNVVTDGIEIVNGIFDPLEVELGDYLFTYTTVNENGCYNTIELTLNINDECVVLPCGLDRIKISKAVTPNGDGFNETFRVTGAVDCGYIVELKLFNRFGDIVYQSNDYQNDWSGISPNSSIGNAGRLPNGTYYYVVVLKNSGLKPIAGPIYLGTK